MSSLPHVIAVIGPTASGKSALAVELALAHNGEVVSADSRQLYRELDLGVGKVLKDEMKGIPHHLLSVLSLDETCSVYDYVKRAFPLIDDIIARNKTPIICGGTLQYVHALLYETSFPNVPPDEIWRKSVEYVATEDLCKGLEEIRPELLATIDTHNRTRVLRALEIARASETIPKQPLTKRYEATIYEMNPSSDVLRERIRARIDKRIELGMLDEIRDIVKKQNDVNILKRYGLEYTEGKDYVEGNITLEQFKEKLFYAIWHYAKRQKTYAKKYFPETIKVEVK